MKVSPLVGATIALLLGIVLASVLPFLSGWVLLPGILCLLVAPLLRRFPPVALLCWFFPITLFGITLTQQRSHPGPEDISTRSGTASQTITGTVTAESELRHDGSLRYPLSVTTSGDNKPASGTLWVIQKANTGDVPHFGDTVALWGRVESPEGSTNPGGFDYRQYLQRRGIFATLTARHSGDVRIVASTDRISLLSIAAGFRRTLLGAITHSRLPPDDAALVSGVLLAERDGIPIDLDDALERTGTVHILSVSGLHLTALAAILIFLTRFLPPKRALRIGANLTALALIWLFVLAAGMSAATVRAAVMTTVFLLAPVFRRDTDSRHVLLVAAFVVLLSDPMALYDAGAQLSFACVGGLLYWVDPLHSLLLPPEKPIGPIARFGRRLVVALLVGIVAQVAAAPLSAYHFSFLSLIAPVANLVLVPISELLLLATLITAVLGASVPLPALLWEPVHGLCAVLHYVAFLFAAPEGAAWALPPPPVISVLLFYLVFGGLGIFFFRMTTQQTFFPKVKPRPALWQLLLPPSIALVVLPALVLLPPVWNMQRERQASGRVRITFLDVGQGDSTVIETPDGAFAVIDGGGHPGTTERYGGDPGNRVVVPYLRYRGVNRVSLLVPTHPDEDHVQGLIAVAARIPVTAAWDGGVPDSGTDACTRLRALLRRKRIPVMLVQRGEVISLGKSGVVLEILHPTAPLLSGTRSDTNANSIVVRLHYGQATVLLTGDADEAAEESMLRAGVDVRSDILKVGHHGSRYSSLPAFLTAVRPTAAVVSAGKDNAFGHPAPEVLERLQRVGATVYRTDQQGAITLETDGKQLWITPYK